MQVLLPPSETKRTGGSDRTLESAALSHAGALGDARAGVRAALETLSRDEAAAAKALKLGAKSRGELAHNLRLDASGTLPAIERYTGVLYDALDVPTLDPSARAWLGAHVSVQSALFGLVSAADPVPAYRLSGGSVLPGLGNSLKQLWRDAHTGVDWADFGWVLDLRSKDYVALAPLPAGQGSYLHVAQRGTAGEVRALNHFNKAAKGDLVRRLALTRPSLERADDFIAWAGEQGLEVTRGTPGRAGARGAEAPGGAGAGVSVGVGVGAGDAGDVDLTLLTELGAPASV